MTKPSPLAKMQSLMEEEERIRERVDSYGLSVSSDMASSTSTSFKDNGQNHAAPKWFTEKGTDCSDRTRMRMPVPGTAENPFVFQNQPFRDLVFELGDPYVHFIDCTFERCRFEGDGKNMTNTRPKFVKDSTTTTYSASTTLKHVRLMGTHENPLIFVKRTFAYLDMEFGEVYARLEECEFIQCRKNGFGNTDRIHCVEFDNDKNYNKNAYAFCVLATNSTSQERIYGTVSVVSVPRVFTTAHPDHDDLREESDYREAPLPTITGPFVGRKRVSSDEDRANAGTTKWSNALASFMGRMRRKRTKDPSEVVIRHPHD